jgi:putative redox protein
VARRWHSSFGEDTVNAIVESLGKVGSHARVGEHGEHEVVFDQPAGVPGGENRGPSPLDAMIVSIAACAHYFASAFLFARGHATEALTVEVESEKQRLPVSRIGRLTLKVGLPGGLSEREIAGVERAIKGCPAYGTLLHPPTVEISVVAQPMPDARRSA